MKSIVNKISKNKLLKNFGFIIASRLVSAALGFCLTFVLWELPRDGSGDFGKYSFYIALASTIPFFINLGIDKSFVVFTSAEKDEKKYTNYLGLFWKSKLILSFLILIGCFIYYFVNDQRSLIIIALLAGLVFGFSESFKPPAESKKNFGFVALIVPIRNLILLILSIILLANDALTLQNIILCLLIANSVYLVSALILYKLYVAPFTLKTNLPYKTLIGDSKWLFVKELVQLFSANMEIFVLTFFIEEGTIDVDERLYFASAFSVCKILPLFTSSLTKVLLPSVVNIKTAEHLKFYIQKLSKTLLISIPLAVIFFGLVYFFVTNYKESYSDSLSLMPLIILGTLFTFYTNNVSLIFYRKGKIHFISTLTVIQFIVGASLCLYLIPIYGANGAITSFLCVRAVGFIITLIKTRISLYGASSKIGE
mgnify:CR=1 FL=1